MGSLRGRARAGREHSLLSVPRESQPVPETIPCPVGQGLRALSMLLPWIGLVEPSTGVTPHVEVSAGSVRVTAAATTRVNGNAANDGHRLRPL